MALHVGRECGSRHSRLVSDLGRLLPLPAENRPWFPGAHVVDSVLPVKLDLAGHGLDQLSELRHLRSLAWNYERLVAVKDN